MLVDESTNVTLGDGFTNFMKLVAGCYFHTQFVLNTRMMLSVLIILTGYCVLTTTT